MWSDHDLNHFSRIDHFLGRLCARLYGTTLAVSEAVKGKYKRADKVAVLYNGLDTAAFKADKLLRLSFRNKCNIPEHAIVVGMAASICADKGQLELISVFSHLSETHSNLLLLLAGTYAHDAEYNSQVKASIAAKENIKYIGYIDDVVCFYNGCDIVVNNSNIYRSESLGTSIYEAMACERIVVAAATGGTPEIITHNDDGFLFPTEDYTQLEHTLSGVIRDYDSLDTVRKSARRKVLSKFNISTMVQNYNRLLKPQIST